MHNWPLLLTCYHDSNTVEWRSMNLAKKDESILDFKRMELGQEGIWDWNVKYSYPKTLG